ncbi:SGNH/GDSL hydrolase family protein [Curtobacterium sp. MCBD17_026]|uniref:SGNH/GDSL hydrolase family protein n=1 Tax=Curtobacterium sp. MCBD17_026 TaxID=2175621 RepID=UPI0011B5559E|nr:SGNH/GDSL hydrolase family protein [Curtobacterium sp. MCBD17_026]WIB69812.1 SGNH/GDSL hydrolase family protein [Curtobacterium sp. MCBD17_026]
MATEYATLLVKRRDADAWASAALPLGSGEWGYDETNRVTKIGDGFTPWADLPEHLTAAGDGQLPDSVRSALAANLADPDTVEGAAVAAAGAGLPFDDESGLYLDASANPIPSVDGTTKQFPDEVRAAQAANLRDPATPEGDAVADIVGATTAGGVGTALVDAAADPNSAFSVVNGASIGASSTTLLTSKIVDSIPSNGSDTNTFAAVSGLTFSFVAPLSGKVVVRISAGYALPSGTSSLELNLRQQSGQNMAKTTRRMRRVTGAAAAGEQNQYVYTMPLSGLVAGQKYDLVQGFRNGDPGGGSVSILADSSSIWGPATIEVLAVPADPVSPTDLYNRFDSAHLSKWSAGRSAVTAGTADAKVLVIGDSTAFGYPKGGLQQSWSHKLAQKLAARGLAAQDGGTTPGLGAGDNPRWVPTAGFPNLINYGFGAQGWQYNGWSGPLTTYFDPFITADSFDVYYVRGSGSTSITLQIDNETAQTFDTTGSTSIGKLTISSSAASTSHTLKVSAVGNGAVLFIEPWLSTSKRIRVANAGAPSTNTITWASGIGIYSTAMIQTYQPSVVVCLLGANDAIGGIDAATVTANLGALAAASAAVGADFINLSSVPCQIPAEAALQKQYALRTRYGTSPAFIDLNGDAGSWANWNQLGYMGDLRHPNEAGMDRIAQIIDAGLALV